MTRTIIAKSRIALAAATVLGLGAAGTSAAFSQVSANRAKLVPLQNRSQAETIIRLFGRRALWAFDPATKSYRSVVNWKAPAGSTLYTPESRVWALDGRLNGLGAAVRSVGGSAASTAAAAYRHHHGAAPVTTTSAPPDLTANGPTGPTAGSQPVATTAPPAGATGSTGGAAAATSDPLPSSGVAGPWNLVFDDEFNGSSVDTTKWTPYWFSDGSTSNGTSMLSSNVSESGGSLNLTLNGSGGLVSSNGKFQFTYGYVEARVYLPPSGSEVANWPAVWTDGQSWPADGEMDIMEGLGGSACWHFHDPSGGPGGCASGNFSGWHTYGADWEPGSVTYYYDGQKVGTITSGITSSPMYLILENSGGSDGGPSVQPSVMKVDYVRVWQHS